MKPGALTASVQASTASALKGVAGSAGLGSAGAAAATPGVKVEFSDMIRRALDNVSAAQNESSKLGQRYQMGDPAVGIEQMMIASQTANVQFQAVVAVRNRLVQAYQDIMNMPV